MKEEHKIALGLTAAFAVFVLGHNRKKVSGVGKLQDAPDYTLSLLNRYLSCHEIFDVQVVLNDTNSKGYVYVLCGDDQGGRDFYLSRKNIPYLASYCMRRGVDFERFYLPQDALSGIGATKRRIYKEISLAQKAGVDFSKKYEDLTKEEIKALQRVSNGSGFTETYYKGLKKAYDAISGIGAAYNVIDEEGNTVLTWIEDPEAVPGYDAERDRALLEARTIDDERLYATENKACEMEAREKQLAAQRKRLSKAGRSSQMALFGCGTGALSVEDGLEPELLEFVRNNVDRRRMSIAFDKIDEMRCPLSMAEPTLYNDIVDLVEEWCTDNAIDSDSIWELFDAEDIFWAL